MSQSLQKTVSFCPAQLLPFLSCIRYTSFLLHIHRMYYTSYVTEPLSSEICRHNQLQQPGWAWCSGPALCVQLRSNRRACFTTGPAPQGLPHTAATPLQIFLKQKYPFQGDTTQSSSRAAPPRRPELTADTAQALSPNSSLLSPHHWRAKLTVNIWLFIQPDEMPVCLADLPRAAWFSG